MSSQTESTAGQGDPYWYEWFVGLNEVVKMLDPDSGVQSVAFQVQGVKGWDDVVVRMSSGRRCYYQVKHTRTDQNLTFGNLVTVEDRTSLLKSLFESWLAGGLNDGTTRCTLYTNRAIGRHPGTTAAGIYRPPLAEFIEWLTSVTAVATSVDDIVPCREWEAAWAEWRGQFSGGTPQEQLAFLRSLDLQTDQADLEALVGRVTRAVASAFGIVVERAAPLVDALHSALRRWTTGHSPVTVETLYTALVLPAEPKALAPAPPPPAPFFPTRIPVATDLERDLLVVDAEPVFFLTAEPGAGKTSLLSWLANRRVDLPFTGRVALRFFCFEPIRPDAPFIAPDASRVRPSDLWFSLLTQLREGLRGRLNELQVPVRNDLLQWAEARGHVLRLASRLGRERNVPFVIVIDGIDHAARAAQTMPDQSAAFFASLPGPDELRGTSVRLLVAGQPAGSYEAQYPGWLTGSHPGVRRVELPVLAAADVYELYRGSRSGLPAGTDDEAVRVIQQHANGNTLATVFAVAETEHVDSLTDLAERLGDRLLADGVTAYYTAVWRHALGQAGDCGSDVDDCLVAALALARRGVTPEYFAVAFADWCHPPAWWERLLESLGPILTRDADGYRVRHNDIRVFLSHRYSAVSSARRTRVAGQLVDYWQRPDADRTAAHLQLLNLLTFADRAKEWPRLFTVEWVIEAGALAIDSDHLLGECEEAVRRLPELRDWVRVVPVACAVETLNRLIASRNGSFGWDAAVERVLPPFLPSESSVRSFSAWAVDDLRALASDANELLDSGELHRATALLRRWLSELDINQIAARIVEGRSSDHGGNGSMSQLVRDAAPIFEHMGRACGRTGWVVLVSEPSDDIQHQFLGAFERGYVLARVQFSGATTLDELFRPHRPGYLGSWSIALCEIAKLRRWPLVREILASLDADRKHLTHHVQLQAAAWAVRSGGSADEHSWITVIDEPDYGLGEPYTYRPPLSEELDPFLSIAYVRGWQRLDLNPRDIAATVYRVYDPNDRRVDTQAPTLSVLRTAAWLGRVHKFLLRDDVVGARSLISPDELADHLEGMLGRVVFNNLRFDHRQAAIRLADEVVEAGERLGGEYTVAVVRCAMAVAQRYPVDQRRPCVWGVLRRHGRREAQIRWIEHWLSPDGELWRLSRDEVHSIVSELAPLAEEVGLSSLADEALRRVRWVVVGYRSHKDYGFVEVYSWFRHIARQSPEIWRTAGWRLWTVSAACDAQGGDNRFESDIQDAVSTAALCCGPADWWSLVEKTVAGGVGGYWHNRIRRLLVDGLTEAVAKGGTFAAADQPIIWGLAVALSYWNDEGDNRSLRALRDSLLSLNLASEPETPLSLALARTQRSESLETGPEPSERQSRSTNEMDQKLLPTAGEVLSAARARHHVLPSVAATVVAKLRVGSDSERDIETLLRAVGVEYGAEWSHGDDNVPDSMDAIARTVSDDQLWNLVTAAFKGIRSSGEYPLHGVAPNLLAISFARAKLIGLPELCSGLDDMLDMHAWWAGVERTAEGFDWPAAPSGANATNWRTVAVRMLGILLRSMSAEVVSAALEGLHVIVDADPALIVDMFAELSDEWPRYWLLHAAEVWAVHHAAAMNCVRARLEDLLSTGTLVERLQAWLILCRIADQAGSDRPSFPRSASLTANHDPAALPLGLLDAPGIPHGHTRLGNRYSTTNMMLENLMACGWNLRHVESEVGAALQGIDVGSADQTEVTPQRRGDILCLDLEVEAVVGRVIESTEAFNQHPDSHLPSFAQAFLDNDEPWLQRSPPRRGKGDGWPVARENAGSESFSEPDVQSSLKQVAMALDLPPGWKTFTARVFWCTSDRDYVLRIWHQVESPSALIRVGRRAAPSCPTGRTFVWWLGTHFEPQLTNGVTFVSGYFAGGRERLGNAGVEIQPTRAWRDVLGWAIDPDNPTVWRHEGEVVAQYERLHGPIRETSRDPIQRQPVLERWIITEKGYSQSIEKFGQLRLRDEFKQYPFRER